MIHQRFGLEQFMVVTLMLFGDFKQHKLNSGISIKSALLLSTIKIPMVTVSGTRVMTGALKSMDIKSRVTLMITQGRNLHPSGLMERLGLTLAASFGIMSVSLLTVILNATITQI
jgi:hypothetical protein